MSDAASRDPRPTTTTQTPTSRHPQHADWLLERQLLKKDWPDALKAVRGQLKNALQELPEEGVTEVGSLIKGKRQQLHYFHCKRIMDLLEGAHEGRVKNFCEWLSARFTLPGPSVRLIHIIISRYHSTPSIPPTRPTVGSYTTPLLRAWAAVLKSYERDNVFLGEAAQALVQNGVYTCPGLRRAIAQLEKQIGDGA